MSHIRDSKLQKLGLNLIHIQENSETPEAMGNNENNVIFNWPQTTDLQLLEVPRKTVCEPTMNFN